MGTVCTGAVCTKGNPDFTEEEDKQREEFCLDNLRLPEPKLNRLLFITTFENNFNLLKNIELVDFMNSLNNLKIDDGDPKNILKISNYMLSKSDWMKFMEYKILNFPQIPTININYKNLLSQYFDDVFDELVSIYNYFYDAQSEVVPKLLFVSFAFNNCNMKIGQKINIFLNLFADFNNEIELTNEIYSFLYGLVRLALNLPIRFFIKNEGNNNLEEFCKSVSPKNYEFISENEIRVKTMIDFLSKEIKVIFGEEENKKYKKEEFKLFLTSLKGSWILDNNLIRSKLELCLP